jgi:hypothetical protein
LQNLKLLPLAELSARFTREPKLSLVVMEELLFKVSLLLLTVHWQPSEELQKNADHLSLKDI